MQQAVEQLAIDDDAAADAGADGDVNERVDVLPAPHRHSPSTAAFTSVSQATGTW